MQINGKTQAICVLVLLLIGSTACNRHPAASEYDVLSAYIDSEFATRKGIQPLEPIGNGVAKIVIRNMTESDESGRDLRMDGKGQPIPWQETASLLQNKAPTLTRKTLDAFREVNRQQAFLQRFFHSDFDYELVDETQLDSIFKAGDWFAFYKRFPGSPGIMAFSRVGFNEDGTQALLYASNTCGGLCGGGYYVLMEKHNGRWVIVKEIEMWIS